MDSGVVFKKKKRHENSHPAESQQINFAFGGFEMIPIQGSFFRAANMFIFFKRLCAFCLSVSWTISMASGQPWLMIEGIGTSNSSLHGHKRRVILSIYALELPGTLHNIFSNGSLVK